MKIHKQKGFTLIELIIVIALLTIVMGAAFSLLMFGNRVFAKSTAEFEMQSDMRQTVSVTNSSIRQASALFIVPASTFPSSLTESWNYFGVQPAAGGGNEVVEYTWNAASSSWDEKVLMSSNVSGGITYGMRFMNPEIYNDDYTAIEDASKMAQNNLLRYELYVMKDGVELFTIETELEGINASQVVEMVPGQGVAIAYKTELRNPITPNTTKVLAQVAMVLDESGSMSDSMDDESFGIPVGSTKMKILKRVSIDLVSKLARQDSIELSLIPYSTNANYPRVFLNAYENTAEISSEIQSMTPDGGTNTGDGMRRANWRLVNNKAYAEQEAAATGTNLLVSSYVIILSDGEATYRSYTGGSSTNYYYGEGRVDGSTVRVGGTGNSDTDGYNLTYALNVAKELKKIPNLKAYVIGFVNSATGLNSINKIAEEFGVEARYASSSFELEAVFTDIYSEISSDVWYLQGPKIN